MTPDDSADGIEHGRGGSVGWSIGSKAEDDRDDEFGDGVVGAAAGEFEDDGRGSDRWIADEVTDELGTDELDADDGDVTAVYPRQRKRTSPGTMLGAAMLGLREVLYGKVSEDEVIEIEVSGDPPNIDIDGLDELIGEQHRMHGPPLDEIRARGRMSTRRPSRRSADR